MRLTKDKLIALWNNRQSIFADHEEIKQRYDEVKTLFEEILQINCVIGDNVSLDGEQLLFRDEKYPSLAYFACKIDKKTDSGAFNGVVLQANSFPEKYRDLILRIGCLLGGFDFKNNYWMRDEYRIISNAITSHNDGASLTSEGQIRHPSSHFADNNYFFNVISTIQSIKEDKFDPDCSRLALRWPHTTYYSENVEENEKSQRDTLKHRFPYKFFYMWTHNVLHPVSLMAYRELVNQDDKDLRYELDIHMNQAFDQFILDDGWQTYSQKIMAIIPEESRGNDFWNEMSLLLSIVMIQDQSLVNMEELLKTGNQAIILYGPPGTGKTYSAKRIILKQLGIEKEAAKCSDEERHKFETDELEKCKYHPGESISDRGAWTLIQFHPNYTYEDFIGGISPELSGKQLSYTLKEGIFKSLCDEASRTENKGKPFFIVIDEINRADLSAIFGELMYALEYRGEKMSIPNFKEQFSIPKNVYVIGTMNSIDKSLVTFDLALRRRFAFYKIMPQVSLLESMLSDYNIEENCLNGFIQRCEELNEKLSDAKSPLQLGQDYQIGHAYFGKISDFLKKRKPEEPTQSISTFELEKLWQYHLSPLIEEYVGSRIEDENVAKYIDELMLSFTGKL